MIDRWTVFIYRTPVAGIDQRLDSRGFWVRYKDHLTEVERLRTAMTAVASMPGKEWLIGQLALGEALQGGGDHLDYVMALVAEAKEEAAVTLPGKEGES